MAKEHRSKEDAKGKVKKPSRSKKSQQAKAQGVHKDRRGLGLLQRVIGNQAVGRLVQRKGGDGGFTLDEETTARINRERGSGQALDSEVQDEVGGALGADLSGVNVHTSPEADELNRDVGAKAFTTGQDIFFREGEYDPRSTSGKELLTHELSHVVQQGSGQVQGGGSGEMRVNEPGDQFEREADAVAKSVAEGAGAEVAGADTAQRQVEEEEEMMQPQVEEEEEMLQAQVEEEEEMMQPRLDEGADLQRQELPEEEEVQMQETLEEEELQMQELPEEEEVQMKRGNNERGSRA